MDKQYVRNLVDTLGWDHSPPPPSLDDKAVAQTLERYRTAVERITRHEPAPQWGGATS